MVGRMNDGLRAAASLSGGALLLFAALVAGLRWSPEPEPERGFGEPVATAPFGFTYPELLADSVVRVVTWDERSVGDDDPTRRTFELWRRLDANGNTVGGYSVTGFDDGAVSMAAYLDRGGFMRTFVEGDGCTEQRFERIRPESRRPGSPLLFLGAAPQGWTPADPPAMPPLPRATEDARANLRWTLADTSLSWWEAPGSLVPGADPGQQLVVGLDPETGLVLVGTNRIPPASAGGDAEHLTQATLLVERFDRVPGLQAMREAMNFDELCSEE